MSFTRQESRKMCDRALKKLEESAIRIRTPNAAYDLWQKVFTEPERARLGGDLASAYRTGGAIRMWVTVYGCTDVRAVIEVANKLGWLPNETEYRWLLKEAGELLNAEEAFEDAIWRNELVLNSLTREIYWMGEPTEIEGSHEAKWAFMWELAKHAKLGRPVDAMTFGENKKPNYVSKTKSELTSTGQIPLELADRIQLHGRGTQKLEVTPSEIRLFEHNVAGEIREWMP